MLARMLERPLRHHHRVVHWAAVAVVARNRQAPWDPWEDLVVPAAATDTPAVASVERRPAAALGTLAVADDQAVLHAPHWAVPTAAVAPAAVADRVVRVVRAARVAAVLAAAAALVAVSVNSPCTVAAVVAVAQRIYTSAFDQADS
ncbi:hypothetical protein ACLKA6_015479 [Drosophila palustris]